MKKIFSRFVKVLMLCLLALILTRGALNYSGFCYAEKRWLSDEEMIRIVLEDHRWQTVTVSAFPYPEWRLSEEMRTETAEAFLDRNPDCCRVLNTDTQNAPTFMDRLFGYFGGAVEIRAIMTYVHEDGTKRETEVYHRYPLTNCGTDYY